VTAGPVCWLPPPGGLSCECVHGAEALHGTWADSAALVWPGVVTGSRLLRPASARNEGHSPGPRRPPPRHSPGSGGSPRSATSDREPPAHCDRGRVRHPARARPRSRREATSARRRALSSMRSSRRLGIPSSCAGQLVRWRAAETAGATGSRSQLLTRPPPGTPFSRAASGPGNRPRSDTASVRA